MVSTTLLLTFLLAISLWFSSASAFTGQGTFYSTGLGSCGITSHDTDLIVALNAPQMGNSGNSNANPNCGKKIKASGPNGSVVVTVVDTCPVCGFGDLDFSPSAFGQIASFSAGRVSISWDWYDGGSSSPPPSPPPPPPPSPPKTPSSPPPPPDSSSSSPPPPSKPSPSSSNGDSPTSTGSSASSSSSPTGSSDTPSEAQIGQALYNGLVLENLPSVPITNNKAFTGDKVVTPPVDDHLVEQGGPDASQKHSDGKKKTPSRKKKTSNDKKKKKKPSDTKKSKSGSKKKHHTKEKTKSKHGSQKKSKSKSKSS